MAEVEKLTSLPAEHEPEAEGFLKRNKPHLTTHAADAAPLLDPTGGRPCLPLSTTTRQPAPPSSSVSPAS